MQPGHLLAGRYRLEERVGSGGGGEVWRAVDEVLGRIVAVKRALAADSEKKLISRLRREANLLARLNHPHIVTLFDAVEDRGEWWLVMEYVTARSLADQGVWPPERAASLGADIALALEAVHGAGIVHGDVKPGNILVTGDGKAKLSDFGTSHSINGTVSFTDTTIPVAGTPAYAAPEVARGEKPTSASDIFSLGATLFAVVEGKSPYEPAENLWAMLRHAAEERIAEPSQSGGLAPVISDLMRPEPALRPDAAQARQQLQAVVSGHEVPRPGRPSRRWRPKRGTAIVASATAAVLAGGTWLVIDQSADHRPARATAVSLFGDPHTVNPCALHDRAQLTRFGSTDLDPAYGGFARCDVIVSPPSGGRVDVKAELIKADPTMETPGRIENVGGFKVWHETNEADRCFRMLLLGANGMVDIGAKADGQKPRIDMCALADTAVRNAVAVLSRGQLPRRTTRPASTSLFWSDACSLLDAQGLSKFPGVDALHPLAQFGNWECDWWSTISGDQLLVRADQSASLSADDGRPARIGGHEAVIETNGYGDDTCLVRVLHRRFTISKTQKTEELLIAIIGSPREDPAQRCQVAKDIAEAATPHLPRT